jgi:glycosyltransferase involved in cell wall biosynthesis
LNTAGGVDYHFGTLLRDSDSIVVLSGAHEEVIEKVHPGVGRKCLLIPPPANMCMSRDDRETRERGRKTLGAAPDDFLLSYIGFIYPGKGLDTLLRAFREVAKERPNVRLAMIGGSLGREFPDQPNYLERMQALAKELGVEDKVVWTGEYFWDREDASVYLRASDACVLPFENGVFLNNSSFSSAANHGLPVITTQPAERPFVHRRTVMLCPPQSPDALTTAIKDVMDDRTLRETLSEGSLALAREWYTWDAALAKTTSLFKRSPAVESTQVVTELQG